MNFCVFWILPDFYQILIFTTIKLLTFLGDRIFKKNFTSIKYIRAVTKIPTAKFSYTKIRWIFLGFVFSEQTKNTYMFIKTLRFIVQKSCNSQQNPNRPVQLACS